MESINCLMGIANCINIDPTQIVGSIVKWQEIITLGGIIFAISEFIEKDRFRKIIFQFSSWARLSFILIFVSILSIIFAYIIPLIPSKTLFLVSYPAFWELISLGSFSIAIILLIVISLYTKFFIPKFKQGFSQKNKIIEIAKQSVLYEKNPDSYNALLRILKIRSKEIFSRKERDCSYFLIDNILSDNNFCKFICENDIGFIIEAFNTAEKNRLWNSGIGNVFFQNLFRQLLLNEKSFLSIEDNYSGTGVSKPVNNTIFKSFGIIRHYRILDHPVQFFKESEREYFIVKNYSEGLKIVIEKYYCKEFNLSDNPAYEIKRALMNLASIPRYISSDKYRNKQEYYYESILSKFGDLCVFSGNFYTNKGLKFSTEEENVKSGSVAFGIVESIFEYLDGLTWLKRNDDDVRWFAHDLFWILYGSGDTVIAKNMTKKLLEKIQERVEENLKGHYTSMAKLMISINGHSFLDEDKEHDIVRNYIKKVFYDKIASMALENDKNAKTFLPDFWTYDLENKIIYNNHRQIVYQSSEISIKDI